MVNLPAYWGTFHGFTQDQRDRFCAILKLDPEKTKLFIDLVERDVQEYVGAVQLMYDYPLEPNEVTRSRLLAVSARANKLAEAIDALHPYQSGARFERMNFNLHDMAVDLDELRRSLDTVAAVAKVCASQKAERGAGRPQFRVHYGFVGSCVEKFEVVFGKKPRYSHRSRFQNFLGALSAEVLPENQCLKGNFTKLIDAALQYRRTHS